LRLAGSGEPGHRGGPPGNLLIRISVTPDDVFDRDGNDLRYKARVPYTTLALGGEVDVPTLRGHAKMRVPPGTQSGQSLRLGGQGIESGGRRGDLFVTVEAEVRAISPGARRSCWKSCGSWARDGIPRENLSLQVRRRWSAQSALRRYPTPVR